MLNLHFQLSCVWLIWIWVLDRWWRLNIFKKSLKNISNSVHSFIYLWDFSLPKTGGWILDASLFNDNPLVNDDLVTLLCELQTEDRIWCLLCLKQKLDLFYGWTYLSGSSLDELTAAEDPEEDEPSPFKLFRSSIFTAAAKIIIKHLLNKNSIFCPRLLSAIYDNILKSK